MFRWLAILARVVVPKRRWMQFSLGTLLVVVAALCVWLAWHVELARRQREAVTELHKLRVAVLYRTPGLRDNGEQEPAWLRRVLGAAYREPVTYVGFQHAAKLQDEPERIGQALALLAELRGLKRLSLEGLPVTDNDLMHLKSLAELQRLDLSYTEVTADGVARLQQALPNCKIVRFR